MIKKCNIAFIIPTKDRPEALENLLGSLSNQTTLPVEIVVVDSSKESIKCVLKKFPNLNIKYQRFLPPSVSKQCNAGIKSINYAIPLIGICGDDTEFEREAIENISSPVNVYSKTPDASFPPALPNIRMLFSRR